MDEAISHPQTHPDVDSDDESTQGYCHDVAEAVSARSAEGAVGREIVRHGWSAALILSVLLHVLFFALAWVLAPVVIERIMIRPVMIFQEGQEHIGDPHAPAEMPTFGSVELPLTTIEPPPVDLPVSDLPEAPPVQIAPMQVQLPDFQTPPPEQMAGMIGLSTSSEAAMNPNLPRTSSGPATAPVSADPTPAPAGVIVSAPPPARSGNYAPPKVARGFAGRRGLRGGLDDRGLPMPDYPAESRRKGEQGVVELQLMIRADGSIEKIDVLSDPGFPLLVKAATDAIRYARFDPAMLDGRPIAGPLVIPFRFSLND